MVDTLPKNNIQDKFSNNKIVKNFCVIGLNENKITKYKDEDNNQMKFVQNIDIIRKNMKINVDKIENENVKWLILSRKNNFWLRIGYNRKYDNPVTFLKIIECDFEPNNPDFLLIKKSHINKGFRPINILLEEEKDNDFPEKEYLKFIEFDNNFFKIPAKLDVKDIILHNSKAKAGVIGISREKNIVALKDVFLVGSDANNDTNKKIAIIQSKDPYKFKYMPEIIDSYPVDDIVNPGYAMFCFPEGLSVHEYMNTPKSFSFLLTDQFGKRSHASCLIITEEITDSLIKSFIPNLIPEKKLYTEKALLIIGEQPFYSNFKLFLKELYRIQLSNTDKPLERLICHFVDSLYTIPDKSICYYIASKELKFYTPPVYSADCDINEESIELLFIKLNLEIILLLWEGILLERKIFLISQSKSLLTHITSALLSLTFPFKWEQATIPILPEKLRVFIDSPVPSIIGICFKVDMSEFPPESIVINLDKCSVEKYLDKLPKLPQKFLQNMMKRLDKYKDKYNNPEDLHKANNCDEAFNMVMDICEDDKVFNVTEIKDIFYEFFVILFKNYEKYFGFKNKKSKDKENLVFNKELFLKDHSSNDAASFLFKFSETIMFSQFIDSFINYESNPHIQFFIDSIKKDKKNKLYFTNTHPTVSQVIPDVSVTDLKFKKFFYKNFPKLNPNLYIKIDAPKLPYRSKFQINPDEWCYNFLNLNQKDWAKYVIYVIYEIWYQMFSIIIVLYDDKIAAGLIDHAIFLLETLIKQKKIFPSRSLYMKLYRACGRSTLSPKILEIRKTMPENYKQNNQLFYHAFMNGLYDLDQEMLNLKVLEKDTNNSLKEPTKVLMKKSSAGRLSLVQLEKVGELGILEMLNSAIFVHYDICPNCYKNNKKKKLNLEEILGGFKKDKSTYFSTCNVCLSKFFPKIYIIYDNNQKSLDIIETVNLLSPVVLLKEVDNVIKNKGEKYFFISEWYKHKEHKQIFWNIVYYFNVLKLPTFVLTYIKNESLLFEILEDLEKIRYIANSKKNVGISTQVKSNYTNTVGSNGTSRRASFTSADNVSNFGNRSTISNFNGYEIIHFKIIEKIENFLKNNKEIDKSPEDVKSEIMGNINELRNLISKNIDEFILTQKERIEILVGSFDSLFDTSSSVIKKESGNKTSGSDRTGIDSMENNKKFV